MYISKDKIQNGVNSYLKMEEGAGVGAMMDVDLLVLEDGQSYSCEEAGKEVAVLLFEGEATFSAAGKSMRTKRANPFDELPSCLHVCKGTKLTVEAHSHIECYIQKTTNDKPFEAVFYRPEDIQIQRAGDKGELNGTMRRDIITVFDYDNAPYSNMVVGEVLSFPGLWSSYPPHHHPQPEVYFYRFDHPQGFGAGFANGDIFKTGQNGLLVITSDFHSQVTAPGYAMCYVWGIRHLDGDPWLKTRIDDEEHKWLLAPNPEIRQPK